LSKLSPNQPKHPQQTQTSPPQPNTKKTLTVTKLWKLISNNPRGLNAIFL
jgi:hypothetical protein